ncbi:MAG: DNA alkylation repair protein [Gemmataceae bacterium]|nr:DNA alkylation repair protein [Gemmataceae bacterium]
MTAARKGSPRIADIPADVLAGLNAGTLESRTLAEGLAIDFAQLLAAAVPDVPADYLQMVRDAAGQGITRRMELVGGILLRHLGRERLDEVAKHPSDTVRGWACYMIGQLPKLKLKDRLALIRPLADDPHFGVREWAWMPVRPHLAANVPHAVKLLTPWTAADSPFVRRFAVEAMRPRGVWASHIEVLKQNPDLALPLLDPLKADPEKYVQDSVANWLNDAAKSQPVWVTTLCLRWRRESDSPHTVRITQRAVRNLNR